MAAPGSKGFVAWHPVTARFLDSSTSEDPERAGPPACPGSDSPPRQPRLPYTPRCVCDTIFPQAVVAGPGSKPRACRYIQRCSFSKELTQAKLIFAVSSVTTMGKGTGPNHSGGPQAPKNSLRSRRPLHCHCLLLSSPEPFRFKWL